MSLVCSRCGFENSERARFCGGCAAPLAPADAREVRKVVTVLFCDVTGSTALGEQLDPESLRRVMARYFDAVRVPIEEHGGTVEKFIGDAVMAVFGVPIVHEDDALRALHAVVAMREALARLNDDLEHDYGVRLDARFGVNTGEVVAGTAERLATGDAVNVAARLEQAAAPGEILLGRETYRLARGAAEVEELTPLELKGKGEGVPAYRLLAVTGKARARRLDIPIIGRRRELRLLGDAWERAVSERSCVLLTLLGVAGVGKSRLAEELLAHVDARILRGRCLPYGEGITYWPVVEVVRQLQSAGFEPTGPLAGLLGNDAIPTSPDEIAWAVCRLLEEAASNQPLIALLEDIQWGEPAFLDLVEYVAKMSRRVPLLLLCVARPELLDLRSHWGAMVNATTVPLEPLSAAETDELVASVGGGLERNLAERIRSAAQGIPLFVEEMVAVAGESGDSDVVVPPTVKALLASRLDQLDRGERRVLECGSVEGQVFHRGAVQALALDEVEVSGDLAALVRKELIRPEPAIFAGDDGYRFRHILIRDAAYDGLAKASRADMHERVADWLDEQGSLVEHDEIVGYHLEQAYRYRAELGPVRTAARKLAARAAERLVVAGRTATRRGDWHAAVSLHSRAVELLPADDPIRLRLLAELAYELGELGGFDSARQRIDEALARAVEVGDAAAVAHARLHSALLELETGGSRVRYGALLDELDQLAAGLQRLGDRTGLAKAFGILGQIRFRLGNCAGADEVYERAIAVGREQGMRGDVQYWLRWQLATKRYGPTPAADVIAAADALIEESRASGAPFATAQCYIAVMHAMSGEIAAARELLATARPRAERHGLRGLLILAMEEAVVLGLAGDHEAAIRSCRETYELAGRHGETGQRPGVGSHLAEQLALARRYADAEAMATETAAVAAPDDLPTQARLRWVQARVAADRADLDGAERLAREAVDIADATDLINHRGDAHRALAEVLAAAGRDGEAAAEWRTALEHYARKGNLVRAAQVRGQLVGVNAA